MFFSISLTQKDNFNHCYQFDKFCIGTDAGWKHHSTNKYEILYKGYADDDKLVNLLSDIVKQQEPQLVGNFCVIAFNKTTQCIEIKTDRYRGFPIYVQNNQEITNLTPFDWTAWADSLITIDKNLSVFETKFDVIGKIETDTLEYTEVVDQIDNILSQRTKKFIAHNEYPIRAFLSGGVDSLLVYSYLQKFTDNYELVKCQHIDYDRFWLMNFGTIKHNFWGYSQIHHWNDPCILTSGAPGDEFMMRSPTTADLLLKFYKKQMTTELETEQWKSCLHYEYFHRPKNYQIFQQQILTPEWDKHTLFWNLCNIVINDWQHWHIGNTLTWTPLRDLEIFKLFLRLPIEQVMTQIMNSDISIALIENNKTDLSKVISDKKNTDNFMKNLCDLLL